MLKESKVKRRGLTFIEALIAIALLVIFSLGIYSAFQVLLTVTRSSQDRVVTVGLLNERAEFIRNLPYSSIGIVGGVPAGALQPTEYFVRNGLSFTVQNYVRNIDDPFDGTTGGTPNDTSPDDYKLVELRAACTTCKNQQASVLTFLVAPKGLESSSQNGSLFVNVFDANGLPISGANVLVVNTQASPTININDVTNINGIFPLIDTPTGTLSYQITVSKSGYSSERTYQPGLPENPNPVNPHATVLSQELTSVSFAIDKLSTLVLNSSDNRCAAVPGVVAKLDGSKLIGASPNIKKYSSTSTTNTEGIISVPLEWDTYTLSLDDSAYYLWGIIPYGTILINPSSTLSRQVIVSPQVPGAVLVNVLSAASGTPLSDSLVKLEGGAINKTVISSYATASDTVWFANYATHDGFMDPDSSPGFLSLLISEGAYSTSTWHWLISNTIDFGAADVSITAFDYEMASLPAQTDVKFQLAVNNDNATWNFVGPNSNPNTYFTASSTLSDFSNNRYLRYKVFFQTDDPAASPRLDSVTFAFRGGCMPPNQVLFAGLPSGTYTLTVNHDGYAENQSTLTVGQYFQEVTVQL